MGGGSQEGRAWQPSAKKTEVWGCGGAQATETQGSAAKQNRDTRESMRKVDRKAFAENAFDREFLLSKTFADSRRGEER